MAKKKFTIPENMEEKFMDELLRQKMNMNNAQKALEETGLGKWLDKVAAKMKDEDEMKQVVKNKTIRELFVGNMLSAFGINEIKITKK